MERIIMGPVLSYNNVYISGNLKDFNENVISKKKVYLYQGQEEQLAFFKTQPDGSFRVSIPNKKQAEVIELLFRLTNDVKHCDPDTNVTLLRVRHETEEVSVTVRLNMSEIFLGVIQMKTAFDEEQVPLSYALDIGKAIIPSFLKGTVLQAKSRFFGTTRSKSIEEIQLSYGVTPVPLTDRNIWQLLTNGICPIYFKDEQNGTVSAEFNWNSYHFDKLSLPNTKAYFSGWEASKPKIEKIEVQYRKALDPVIYEEDMHPKTTHYPTDPDFMNMKRKFNNGAFLFGQTVYHLGWGHVYGTRIAQLSYDYLKETKLGELILPHCKFIRKITNTLGKTAIMGKGGILDRSPLSTQGILQAITKSIGALNPFTSKPRKPMNDDHVFAKDSQIVYDELYAAIDEIITENWKVISTDDWKAVSAFFYKVHTGSPFFQQWENADINQWVDSREIGGVTNLKVPKRTKSDTTDLRVRSIPLIANDSMGPKEHDKEMITLFITDYIHRVVFWHSSIHRTQYKESQNFPHTKDVNSTPICLEGNGDEEFGGILEADALQQHELLSTFEKFKIQDFGITRSDSGAHPRIVKAFNNIASKISVPLEEIAVSTVI